MGKAVNYSLNNYENITHYCLDERLAIDNNKKERQAKSFVMMR